MCNFGYCTVSIRITPVPDTPPVAVKDSFDCIDEGGFIQILMSDDGILSNDHDEDPGSTLSAVLVTYPLNGVLILNPNGTFIILIMEEKQLKILLLYAVDDTGLTSDTVAYHYV